MPLFTPTSSIAPVTSTPDIFKQIVLLLPFFYVSRSELMKALKTPKFARLQILILQQYAFNAAGWQL